MLTASHTSWSIKAVATFEHISVVEVTIHLSPQSSEQFKRFVKLLDWTSNHLSASSTEGLKWEDCRLPHKSVPLPSCTFFCCHRHRSLTFSTKRAMCASVSVMNRWCFYFLRVLYDIFLYVILFSEILSIFFNCHFFPLLLVLLCALVHELMFHIN